MQAAGCSSSEGRRAASGEACGVSRKPLPISSSRTRPPPPPGAMGLRPGRAPRACAGRARLHPLPPPGNSGRRVRRARTGSGGRWGGGALDRSRGRGRRRRRPPARRLGGGRARGPRRRGTIPARRGGARKPMTRTVRCVKLGRDAPGVRCPALSRRSRAADIRERLAGGMAGMDPPPDDAHQREPSLAARPRVAPVPRTTDGGLPLRRRRGASRWIPPAARRVTVAAMAPKAPGAGGSGLPASHQRSRVPRGDRGRAPGNGAARVVRARNGW